MESITLEEIPEDCDMLIINGPTMDFTEEETTMIDNFLQISDILQDLDWTL